MQVLGVFGMTNQIVGAVEQQGGTVDLSPVTIDGAALHCPRDDAAVDRGIPNELEQPIRPFRIAGAESRRAIGSFEASAPLICVQVIQRPHVLRLGQWRKLASTRSNHDTGNLKVARHHLRRSSAPGMTDHHKSSDAMAPGQFHRSLSEFLERVGSAGRRTFSDAGNVKPNHAAGAEQPRNDMIPGVQTLARAVQQEE